MVVSASPAAAFGLSPYVHIFPSPTVRVAVTGCMLDLHYPRLDLAGGKGGERGQVTGFSRRSRSRMQKTLASCDQAALINDSLFITLTYPDEWSPDPAAFKGHLTTFCKRLLRKWPRLGVIWKIELQERGAPHYHLLVLGQRFIPWQWVSYNWFDVVGSGDPWHLEAGTSIEAPKCKDQLKRYMSKYMSKDVDI